MYLIEINMFSTAKELIIIIIKKKKIVSNITTYFKYKIIQSTAYERPRMSHVWTNMYYLYPLKSHLYNILSIRFLYKKKKSNNNNNKHKEIINNFNLLNVWYLICTATRVYYKYE